MKKHVECRVCGNDTTIYRTERNAEGKKVNRPICENCWRVIKNNPENKAKVFKGE